MIEYKVATNSFQTIILASQRPMVPCRDHGSLPPALWGGAPDRPVLVNQNGEFKTRGEIEGIYETQPYYRLLDEGFRKLVSFAEVGAQALEELEVREPNEDYDSGLLAEFIPHCEHREYTSISSEDDVLEDFLSTGTGEPSIKIRHFEVEAQGSDEATYVAFVILDNATYKVVIHERYYR